MGKEPSMCSSGTRKSITRPSLPKNNTWMIIREHLWMIFMHLTLKRKPHIGYHTINKEEIKGMLTCTFYGAHMQELSTISLQQMKMLN